MSDILFDLSAAGFNSNPTITNNWMNWIRNEVKFDSKQVLLLDFLINTALGLFALGLGTLAHLVLKPVLTQQQLPQPPLLIDISYLPVPTDRNLFTTETSPGIKNIKPSEIWLHFWGFLDLLEFPLAICTNHDLHFLGESSRYMAKSLVKSCHLKPACGHFVLQKQTCLFTRVNLSTVGLKN